MIRVRVGGNERALDDISEQWVNEQINRRRADGVPICVEVIFDTPDVRMGLSSPICGSGGGSRPPNNHERAILDLWEKHHLNTDTFTGGNLIGFLKKLER